MGMVLRGITLLVVFAGVGWMAARLVVAQAAATTPVAQVRLAAAMAGLFAGGAAVVVVGIAMVWRRG